MTKIGKFHTVGKPQIKHEETAYPGIPLEEQSGKVEWFAPITLAAGTKPESIKLEGKVYMQLCDEKGGCAMPADYAFTAKYRPDVAAENDPAGKEPAVEGAAKMGPPSPPKDTAASGNIGARPSNPAEGPALPAVKSDFGGPQPTAAKGEINWLPFTNAAELRRIVNPESFDIDRVQEFVLHQNSGVSLLVVLLYGLKGFLGGLILNIMPCVFPVMGLKILSFVQQSGHNRRRAFMLNVCYSAGLLAVFMLLAVLAVLFHLGWGELFGRTWFKISLAVVVFARH